MADITEFMEGGCLSNLDDALQTSFAFKFTKNKSLTYSVQGLNFPSISVGDIPVNYKNYRGSIPDNVMIYEDLSVTFIVDEYFSNYNYLFKKMVLYTGGTQTINELFDDLHLFRLNSNKKPIADVVFYDAYCTNLSGLEYNSASVDDNVLVCTANIKYQKFDINGV